MDYNYNGGGLVGIGGSAVVIVVVVFGERNKISGVRRFSSFSLDAGFTGWLDFTWTHAPSARGRGWFDFWLGWQTFLQRAVCCGLCGRYRTRSIISNLVDDYVSIRSAFKPFRVNGEEGLRLVPSWHEFLGFFYFSFFSVCVFFFSV